MDVAPVERAGADVAEPGTSGASAFITAPQAARVATGFAGSNFGSAVTSAARSAMSPTGRFQPPFFHLSAKRWSESVRDLKILYTSSGTTKDRSGSKPSARFSAAVSSAPSGAPWQSAVSCLVGAPRPITVLATTITGWPFTFAARR